MLRSFNQKPIDSLKLTKKTFSDWLFPLKNNTQVFCWFYQKGTSVQNITYSQYIKEVAQLSDFLQNTYKVNSSHRVITCLDNKLSSLIIYGALLYLNVSIIHANPKESDDYLKYIASDTRAYGLITNLEKAINANLNFVWKYNSQDYINAKEDFTNNKQSAVANIIFYTSGTTSKPKGVVLSWKSVLINALATTKHHSLKTKHKHMCMLPLHHVNAFNFSFISTIISQGTLILNEDFHPPSFWKTLNSSNAEIVSATPSIINILNQFPSDTALTNLNLKYFVSASAPLNIKEVQQFYKKYKIKVLQSYGLSEAVNFSLITPANTDYEKFVLKKQTNNLTTAGTAVWGTTVYLLNKNTKKLITEENTEGELVLQSWNICKEYLNHPKETAALFKDDYLHTGDLAYFKIYKNQKYYYLSGRKKEIIKRLGESLSPFEIEADIKKNLKGYNFAIVGFENQWTGEEVGLVLEAKTSTTPFSAKSMGNESSGKESLLNTIQNQIPYFKAPKVIVHTDALPVTSTGKIQRKKLAALFLKNKETLFLKV